MLLDRVLTGLSVHESFWLFKFPCSRSSSIQQCWMMCNQFHGTFSSLGGWFSRIILDRDGASVGSFKRAPEMLDVVTSKCWISWKMDKQIEPYQHLLLHQLAERVLFTYLSECERFFNCIVFSARFFNFIFFNELTQVERLGVHNIVDDHVLIH